MQYNNFSIVIIEDNPEDSGLMLRALKKNNVANNHIVLEDGEQALDYLFYRGQYKNNKLKLNELPKVIFLDLKLPKVSGLEILKELKTHKETKKIPVVIVTSSKEDPDVEKAYALGANSYIVKPVDFDQFSKTISEIGLYWLVVNESPKRV